MQKTEIQRAGGTVAKWLSICDQIPEISELGELRALNTVYYPVALLRMKLEEYSFEDFDAIEQSILRFYSCGITKAEEICKWMAIPSVRYIQERLALLKAEGLIGNGQLTELGKESLEIGQKKTLYDAEQIFQADGITGLLLPREYQIKEDHLIDRSKTLGVYPHLAHSESIALSTIQKAIQGNEKIRSYKRFRKSILNVNVSQILDIKVAGIKYIKALLAWPVCSKTPMIFLQYYKRNDTGFGHHCDMPLFIPDSLKERLPDLSASTEIIPDQDLLELSRLYQLIIDDQNDFNVESICNWIRNNTSFEIVKAGMNAGRVMIQLENPPESAELSPLDLEICAALGAGRFIPVEAEMTLPMNNFRRRISFWPYQKNRSEINRQLSLKWGQFSWNICRKAPISLTNAIAFDPKKHSKEEE